MGLFAAGLNVDRRKRRVETSDLTHPRIRMSRDTEGLHVVLPVKTTKYRWLLDLLWFGVWAVAEGVLIATLLGANVLPASASLLGVLLGAFTLAGLFLAYRVLWYWSGKERFDVQAGRLTAAREILGLGRTRTFLRNRIRRIRAQRLRYRVIYPSWGRMFLGNGHGELLIEVDGGSHAYAKGLEVDEARSLAELLSEELEARSPTRRPTEFRLG